MPGTRNRNRAIPAVKGRGPTIVSLELAIEREQVFEPPPLQPAGALTVDAGTSLTFVIAPEDNYRIADVLVDGQSVGAVSSYTFENISADHAIEATFAPFAQLTLLAPNGGEVLAGGDSATISWTNNATKEPVAKVSLAYTVDGRRWTTIATVDGNPGAFSWEVPMVNAERAACTVRVTLLGNKGGSLGSDASDATFTITP